MSRPFVSGARQHRAPHRGAGQVTCAAHYAIDVRWPRRAYAYLATRRFGRGSACVRARAAAPAAPGVLDIQATIGDRVPQRPSLYAGGYESDSVQPLGSTEDARRDVVAIIPLCPFRHPEWQDVLRHS